MFLSIKNLQIFVIVSIFLLSCGYNNPQKILVFSKTEGFYHNSIPDGIHAIQKLGEENGIEVDTTTNANNFTEDILKNYSAVVFLNTTGDVLNNYQEADFERFIQAGGGYMGIHAAADTEYHWGWYGRLVGGYFLDHPGINDPHPNVQEGTLDVVDKTHPATEFLPDRWTRTDEWYSYKNLNEDVNVLMTIDEESYSGGAEMGHHPMAWYHEYDGGRAFYTAGGHTSESYEEELFLEHLLAGIQYAIGENRLDYSNTKTKRVPEENRFVKTTLIPGDVLLEPTEMTILPNLDVLIAQRRGEITLYKNENESYERAGFLDVYWQTDEPGVNAEEGVIGIKADPDFESNRFVYIFYTPSDTSVNRLSRFRFENDLLNMESETVILEFYSQRDICCHTGGSLAFDSDGLLYASTGDNSTPFNQPDQPYVLDGYAPLDEREGFEQYDARRTSGNSNDLRGKILRIKVNDDGSYDIPEGNLYSEGMENTRPEIYVQGTRNPYRISVDPKNGYLYWGEVGPDANNDSLGVRGPRGYDEINQAREAGHFGWPFFVGDNYAYNEYDYSTATPGPVFDPEKPVNRSPHNTGMKELPPAQSAFIWYPYAVSEEFPSVGTGGRNSMAGPVFYSDLYPEETRFPAYYDGKLFIYDWVRDWIKVVTLGPDNKFDKMEPVMANTAFNAVMDMELGPDGRLYLLEYGKGWFSKNPDSGLSRIDFITGNRPPVVQSLRADKSSGLLPLDITFTVDAEDPEQDPMTFVWNINDMESIETNEPVLEYTFDEIGDHEVTVEVKDGEGLSVKSQSIQVYAGNQAPKVDIEISGNNSFYFPDEPVEYSINVLDINPEGNEANIDPSNFFISADYMEEEDLSEQSTESLGHQSATDVLSGRNLVNTLGCRSCHLEREESVGPSYLEVAEHYKDSSNVKTYLTDKIINGSSGVWGEVAMPAHQDMPEHDARRIVTWILSLASEDVIVESLPQSGTLNPTLNNEPTANGVLIISATYTDEGGDNIKSLTGRNSIYLQNNIMSVTKAHSLNGYQKMEFGGNDLLIVPEEDGSFGLGPVDLTGIEQVVLSGGSRAPLDSGYSFELRLDSPDGRLAGEAVVERGSNEQSEDFYPIQINVAIEAVRDHNRHELYVLSKPLNSEVSTTFVLTNITFLNLKNE